MSVKEKIAVYDAGFLVNFLILVVVAINAFSVAQYDHGEILSFASYYFVQHIFVLMLFFAVFWRVIKNPNNAIDILFYLTVLTSGMYLYRFSVFDELITTAVLIGIFVAKKNREYKIYSSIYYIFLFYIFTMSIVGMLIYSEIRALRYIYISVMLITILYFMQRYKLQQSDEQWFHRSMLTATLVYSFAYLLNALIIFYHRPMETILGIGEAGAGYQGVIFLFTIPSCFNILSKSEVIRMRVLAFTAILSATIIALFADSRYIMLTLAIVFIFSLRIMKWNTIILFFSTLVGLTILLGSLYLDNPFILFTLLEDTLAQDFGESRTINYYGNVIETASGDQGRALLILNSFYYFLDGKLTILTGIGTYGYVHEAYATYENLLRNLGVRDNIVNFSAFGTPPRPPSMATYLVDYGLLFLAMLTLLWLSFIKKAFLIFKERPEVMSYPFNLLLFMIIGEQLDTIATYFLLLPVFSIYIRPNNVHSSM